MGRAQVLYIGGWGRSGSTLLSRMLGEVEGCVSVGELQYIWERSFLQNRLCGCGKPARECTFWNAVVDEAFGGWKGFDLNEIIELQRSIDKTRNIPVILMGGKRSKVQRFQQHLSRLYRAILTVSGSRIIVDSSKAPSYAFLLNSTPEVDVRLVHLVRDSRGVAFSWRRKVVMPDFTGETRFMPQVAPTRSALVWSGFNFALELYKWLNPRRYILVRYEDVIFDTDNELKRIVHFANNDHHDLQLQSPSGQASSVNLGSSHSVSGNPMRFNTGKVELRLDEEWREKMQIADRRVVTFLSFPLLYRYGYMAKEPRA